MAGGDAKVAGLPLEAIDHDQFGMSHLFRLDLPEVVLTSVHPEGDRLLIEIWRPGQGTRSIERR